MKRRLTTILAADLVGYTRLIAADEEGVIGRFRSLCERLVDPAVARADGRVFKTMGDGLLAEFASPVEAVRTAITIQEVVAEDQSDQPEARRLRFRIGIHLGDVVVDGSDMLGDAVNIAARLESVAPAGGICISRAVMEQARGRVAAELTPIGPQSLKNLPEPIEVWQIGGEPVPEVGTQTTDAPSPPRLFIVEFAWSGDADDVAALAQGVVEDVSGALARTVVVLRSDPADEGTALAAAKSARATHVLEGAVRARGTRVRLSASLRTVPAGEVIWTRRFDGGLDDLFDLQDRLALAVARETGAELSNETFGLTLREDGTRNLDAWRLYAEALPDLRDLYDAARRARAAASLNRALALDPEFAAAWAAKTNVAYAEHRLAGSTEAVTDGRTAAERAMALAPESGTAWAAMSRALLMERRFDEALEAAAQALRHAPEEPAIYVNYAMLLDRAGRPEEALTAARRAAALDPRLLKGRLTQVMGLALLSLGRYEEAAKRFGMLAEATDGWAWTRLYQAIALQLDGHRAQADAIYASFKDRSPDFVAEVWESAQMHRDPALRARRSAAVMALEQAWRDGRSL